MKYMLLIIGFHADGATPTGEEDDGPTVEAFTSFGKDMVDAGVWVDGSALEAVEIATTVQVDRDGNRIITNGPFAETREFVGGYEIIDVPDLDSALDWAARCPGSQDGRVEVRPLMEI